MGKITFRGGETGEGEYFARSKPSEKTSFSGFTIGLFGRFALLCANIFSAF